MEKKTPSKQNKPNNCPTLSFVAVELKPTTTPSKKEMRIVVPDQKENYITEFRNYDDDAWYTVMVTMEGKQTLRVRYEEFFDEDQLFEPSIFDSLEDLHEFQKRFRPLSVQVQDYECRQLVHGVKVCASQHFVPDDLRFYDAEIDAVHVHKHSRKKDAECLCTFILEWSHGPNAGALTAAEIGDICIVQPVLELDPAVTSFMEIAKRRIESQSAQEMVSCFHIGKETKKRKGYFEGMKNGKRRAKRSVLGACSPGEMDELQEKTLKIKKNLEEEQKERSKYESEMKKKNEEMESKIIALEKSVTEKDEIINYLTLKSAVMYSDGFDKAVEQVTVLHPTVDLSEVDILKTVVDGALVEK